MPRIDFHIDNLSFDRAPDPRGTVYGAKDFTFDSKVIKAVAMQRSWGLNADYNWISVISAKISSVEFHDNKVRVEGSLTFIDGSHNKIKSPFLQITLMVLRE